MARIRPSMRPRSGASRRISPQIYVYRTSERRGLAFEACIRIGKRAIVSGGMPYGPAKSTVVECAYGRNPRKAIANALKKAGQVISKRSGAFAGGVR